jgi:hypothetical protein
MRVTVDGKTYELATDSLLNVECMAVEKVTGLTTGEWTESLGKGSMLAITALVWIIRKRTEPTLGLDEVVFGVASLEMEEDEEPEGKGEEVSAGSS